MVLFSAVHPSIYITMLECNNTEPHAHDVCSTCKKKKKHCAHALSSPTLVVRVSHKFRLVNVRMRLLRSCFILAYRTLQGQHADISEAHSAPKERLQDNLVELFVRELPSSAPQSLELHKMSLREKNSLGRQWAVKVRARFLYHFVIHLARRSMEACHSIFVFVIVVAAKITVNSHTWEPCGEEAKIDAISTVK